LLLYKGIMVPKGMHHLPFKQRETLEGYGSFKRSFPF